MPHDVINLPRDNCELITAVATMNMLETLSHWFVRLAVGFGSVEDIKNHVKKITLRQDSQRRPHRQMGEWWQLKITRLTPIKKNTTKIKWQRNEPAEAEELLNYF